MQLKELIRYLEYVAPPAYQENYDNAGLITGSKEQQVHKAILSLDCTPEVVQEAIENGANLIIAHHPIVFSGLKKLNGKSYVERAVILAIKNDIAIYACHTNLDHVYNGVNDKIAQKIGMINTRILAPKKDVLRKLVTFCPINKANQLREALFESGGGHIGDYSHCSFNTTGTGTFKAGAETQPFVGKKGELHEETEERIELIYPVHIEKQLLSALFEAHPYEEVAYDLIPLSNIHARIGAGLIGELAVEQEEMTFLKHIKTAFKVENLRYTALRGSRIKKVAVCGGAGIFLLNDAIRAGADIFITADVKYHQFFDADSSLILADIGHYETEQFTPELFYDLISKKFPTFAVLLSKINTNPIKYL